MKSVVLALGLLAFAGAASAQCMWSTKTSQETVQAPASEPAPAS